MRERSKITQQSPKSSCGNFCKKSYCNSSYSMYARMSGILYIFILYRELRYSYAQDNDEGDGRLLAIEDVY